MEIKLFGKSLFSAKSNKVDLLLESVSKHDGQSKFLPDFHKKIGSSIFENYVAIESSGGMIAVPESQLTKKGKVRATPKIKYTVTPKGIYELKALNDVSFKLNTDEKYVDEQIQSFKDKLAIIKSEEYDMRNGVEEISSILMRMENRKKYAENKEFFDEFPVTTSSKIAEVIKAHDNLQLGQVAQFLADMPKEAVQIMKDYNANTDKVCGKQAVFYIIADKKDFKKSDTRRDPILLAQSPFGHFWQILGAWDDEMLFLEEL